MYNSALQKQAHALIKNHKFKDAGFQERLTANLDDIHTHFRTIYGDSPLFTDLINAIFQAHLDRSASLKKGTKQRQSRKKTGF